MKKPTVENLKALVYNFELNIYQKKDALLEFEKLNEYIKELEHQLLLNGVSNRRELLLAYEKWFAKETSSEIIDSTIEQLIDKFLSQ